VSKSVLIFAPHGDDEILGVGGAIQKHLDSNDVVTVCFIAGSASSREGEQIINTFAVQRFIKYQNIIHLNYPIDTIFLTTKLITNLDNVVKKCQPDIIYCPWYGDMHQDHRVISHACGSVVRLGSNFKIKRVLLYEVPSSTDQGFAKFETPFVPNYYVGLTKDQIDKKCSGMKMYRLEQGELRTTEALTELAKKRGRECFRDYAEAFVCLRYIDE
jgi:LmbE family N-acetylglucosaminyl deacetylase